jgi:FtsP/CotA-like multicopper oxidase with cupredoxin domain
VLRALTGGGTLAALALGSAAPRAAAATDAAPARGTDQAGAAGRDPFALDDFRPSGRTREYWVQAESFAHNVAPSGRDAMTGMTYTADQTTYQAIGFRAYSPGWRRPLDPDDGPDGVGPNSGIPGPVLRGRVGDTIRVHFRNNDSHYKWPHSMHPHGVRYDPDSDGGWMADDPKRPGTAVPYGGSYTYEWVCTPGSVGSWPYHDHAAPQSAGHGTAPATHAATPAAADRMVMEIGAEFGLFGMIAVTDEQTPEVDREFVLFFHDVAAADAPSLAQDVALCNGGAFVDNAPTFTARAGDRVRWRVGTLGNAFHVFHIHGHRWQAATGWVDSQVLGPATTLTVEYREDNPGDWIYHCHVPAHMMRGMAGRYRVES